MPHPLPPKSRRRLLLVEDDDAVRRALHLLLEGQGYDVLAFASAEDAGAAPEALTAICLVADLRLPGETGAALLRRLREAGWQGRAILVSGRASRLADLERAGRDFDLVLAKPLPMLALVQTIARLLRDDDGDPEIRR